MATGPGAPPPPALTLRVKLPVGSIPLTEVGTSMKLAASMVYVPAGSVAMIRASELDFGGPPFSACRYSNLLILSPRCSVTADQERNTRPGARRPGREVLDGERRVVRLVVVDQDAGLGGSADDVVRVRRDGGRDG